MARIPEFGKKYVEDMLDGMCKYADRPRDPEQYRQRFTGAMNDWLADIKNPSLKEYVTKEAAKRNDGREIQKNKALGTFRLGNRSKKDAQPQKRRAGPHR